MSVKKGFFISTEFFAIIAAAVAVIILILWALPALEALKR